MIRFRGLLALILHLFYISGILVACSGRSGLARPSHLRACVANLCHVCVAFISARTLRRDRAARGRMHDWAPYTPTRYGIYAMCRNVVAVDTCNITACSSHNSADSTTACSRSINRRQRSMCQVPNCCKACRFKTYVRIYPAEGHA